MRSSSTLFLVLAGYLLARAALGALVNPPFNGPDEGGHWEYIETWLATGGRGVTGVERLQPPTYYAVAALPFRLTDGQPIADRLFAVRLLSALAGLVTAGATWLAARKLWPERPLLAVTAAAVATLAPGNLFLLASVNNDPLATALASVAVLAALSFWLTPDRRWLALWLAASVLAIGTKLTAAPVLLGTAAALLWRYRGWIAGRVGRRALAAGGAAGALAVLAVYARLLAQPPSTSRWASLAHFWPLTLLRALPDYVRGGLGESFGTFWYAYDYGVRWGGATGTVLATLGALLVLGAAAGLLWWALGRRRAKAIPPQRSLGLPLVLWLGAGAQIGSVVLRFGFGSVLAIEMGGVAQAKGFFPALLPLALLFTAGWAVLYRALGGKDDRWLTLALLGAFILLDWASLGVSLWQHYRWLQVGS